jgi:hypothetical protein
MVSFAPLMTPSASFYPNRIDDPKAVYLTRKQFGFHGDGIGDDTAALQKAINRVVETTVRGILFVPPGRYRIRKTLRIWPGIRVIGYGPARPVFVLGKKTPGFQKEPAPMVHFAGNIPGHHGQDGFLFQPQAGPKARINFNEPVRDANPGTFYSALSNVDFEIESGNPGAVCVRSNYAQHCFLAHIEFRLGSALAGIHDAGNVAEDLRFVGGKYGIVTSTPSPGWQFCLVDSSFEGQKIAAIKSELSGLTLVRPHFKKVPTALLSNPGMGEQLWIKDGRMEEISGPAILISNENNARNQINLENVVCRNVPVFARFRESGKKIGGKGAIYQVKTFSHGIHVEGAGVREEELPLRTRHEIVPLRRMPLPVATDIPQLPDQETWVDVRTLGVKGDGVTDDTRALKKAIAKHRTLYFPCGAYLVSNTLRLKANTVLIGLHPSATRIFIADATPAFRGVGNPVPVIETAKGGAAIMTGIGVYTNGNNPRAVGVKWRAGKHSFMNDVRFLGGHGTSGLDGKQEKIYTENHSADPDPKRRWDSQYPSLWITDGGGGTIMDIWTPSSFAQSGMLISHTSTEGRIYGMSVEHHVRCEVKLDHVSNWRIYALQLEEERGEGGFALPVEIRDCSKVTFANLFFYRVISSHQPFPCAVKATSSRDIRFRNFHCWSNSKADFDNALLAPDDGLELRQREFSNLTLSGRPPARPASARRSVILEKGSRVEKLTGGFHRLAGGAVDPKGRFYAVEAKHQRIWRWTDGQTEPVLVSDCPLEPYNLFCDRAGNLMVVSYTGKVYALDPDRPEKGITILKARPAASRTGKTMVLPRNYWRGEDMPIQEIIRPRPYHFISPDGTTVLPAGDDFIEGHLSWGIKAHDILRAYGLGPVVSGRPAMVTFENVGKTCSARLDAKGQIRSLELFAERGGESVAVDRKGNVYIAEGNIFVYDRAGNFLETIPVPERPLSLSFGGKDRRTLYIAAGTSLYAVRTRVGG